MAINSKDLWDILKNTTYLPPASIISVDELRCREAQARVQEMYAQKLYERQQQIYMEHGIGQGLAGAQAKAPRYPYNPPPIVPNAPVWRDINTLKAEDPVRMKLTRVISRLVDALPLAVIWEMAQPKCEVRVHEARITVKFHNGSEIEFAVDDKFPADEHLARIALECP